MLIEIIKTFPPVVVAEDYKDAALGAAVHAMGRCQNVVRVDEGSAAVWFIPGS